MRCSNASASTSRWRRRPRSRAQAVQSGEFGYAGPMLAGDVDRERASATLREHYARGYLTLDDLSQRTSRVLTARSRLELRAALFGLPRGGSWALPVASDPRGLIAQGRS